MGPDLNSRAVQRAHRGSAAKPPLPIRRKTRYYDAPLRLALQPPASPIRSRQKNALASHEIMAQTLTGIVQEKAALAHGI